MKYLLSFLILLLTAGVTVAREILSTVGVDTNFLLLTLIAVAVAGLLAYRHLLLVVLVVALSLAANLPEAILAQYHLDKHALLGALLAVTLTPLLGRYLH